jgi:hypothetical protein
MAIKIKQLTQKARRRISESFATFEEMLLKISLGISIAYNSGGRSQRLNAGSHSNPKSAVN